MPLVGEHPPHPSGDPSAAIVVHNHLDGPIDAEVSTGLTERLMCRQWVATGTLCPGRVGIEIDEPSAWNVRRLIGGTSCSGIIDVPATVDDHDISVIETCSEFENGYQRVRHVVQATASVG
jgi:hypothetical protein